MQGEYRGIYSFVLVSHGLGYIDTYDVSQFKKDRVYVYLSLFLLLLPSFSLRYPSRGRCVPYYLPPTSPPPPRPFPRIHLFLSTPTTVAILAQ
jgi:hypothetical protein